MEWNKVAWVLFFIFLTLKLAGFIGWSWVWVFAPLWIPLSVGLTVFGALLLFDTLAALYGGMGGNRR